MQTIQLEGTEPYAMFTDWYDYKWVFKIIDYDILQDASDRVVPLVIQRPSEYLKEKERSE